MSVLEIGHGVVAHNQGVMTPASSCLHVEVSAKTANSSVEIPPWFSALGSYVGKMISATL